jgi:ferredoxin-thioredoxin reductase catalytic subunit
MDVEELYRHLRNSQEKKGYLFPDDREKTIELLNGLLVNKERYGYMSCPCRLASGNYEHDRDIICPCLYRRADVEEYGSCYCNLYVSREWKNDASLRVYVPERRSLEKMIL